MADVVDGSTFAQQQPSSSSSSSSRFLEILCTSSGKIRRFSPDTDAGFALQLINKKLNSGEPLALYIEAVKEGEESISFGFKTKLIHYGDGWSLHTVTADHPHKQEDETSQHDNRNALDTTLDHIPDFMELARCDVQSVTNYELHSIDPHIQEEIELARGDVQSVTNYEFHSIDPHLQEENELARDDGQSARNHEFHLINYGIPEMPITSEPVSDIESQSFPKWDFTDAFTTDNVFSSRDEIMDWIRNAAKAVKNVVVIKHSGPRNVYFQCERGGAKKKKPVRKTTRPGNVSRKCDCPFLLSCIRTRKKFDLTQLNEQKVLPATYEWVLKVVCGYHNHPVKREDSQGSIRGRLTKEEKEVMINMLKVGIRGTEIFKILKDRDPLTEATVKIIYNTMASLRRSTSQCNSS